MAVWLTGLLADKLIKQGWAVTRVRKTLQTVAFLGPALALILLSRSKDPRVAVACMTCALGITSLGQPCTVLHCLILTHWCDWPDIMPQNDYNDMRMLWELGCHGSAAQLMQTLCCVRLGLPDGKGHLLDLISKARCCELTAHVSLSLP